MDGATSTFEILPAIDLRGGRVVRLRQGDFAREDVFDDDPAAAADRFARAGATWLHVVDLDGARAGEPVHGSTIAAILERVGDRPRVEVAGGLRTDEAIDAALAAGAARVVLGTAALRDPSIAARAVERHGTDRVAAAIDVRDGRAVGEAWARDAAGSALADTLEALARAGVTTFEVTAIDRDGLLGGPDLALLDQVVGLGAGRVIASAGIRTIDDLRAVRRIGCVGAIVGRALYDGSLDLADALAALAAPDSGTAATEDPAPTP